MANTKAIGDIGEQLAAEYLESKGYNVLERNVKYAGCEADIICCCNISKDGKIIKPNERNSHFKRLFTARKLKVESNYNVNRVIVFCEVKTRANDEFGIGAEAISPYKIGRYVTLAKAYTARRFIANDDVRFDVIEVGADGKINHIENAFTENDARYPRKSL